MKIKNINAAIRRCCKRISPVNRLFTVMAMIVVFGTANIYITVRAIYEIGRESKIQEFLKIEHIKQLELEKNRQVPSHSNQNEEENGE